MEKSTVQSETRSTLDSGSVGGEHYFVFPLVQCLIVQWHHRSGRVCPGRHIAHSMITITAASVLSTFDLVKQVDENGREIEPKRKYTESAVIR